MSTPVGRVAQRLRVIAGLLVVIGSVVVRVPVARADWVPARGMVDPRMRVAPYSPDQVYRLYGYVGYQIDIEFGPGERFVGLAAGDIDGIAYKAQGRYLFLKPRMARLNTNLTVLTSLHRYEFDYSVSPGTPNAAGSEVIYSLRFTYPRSRSEAAGAAERRQIASALAQAPAGRPRNYDYWYCGSPSLKPRAVWDDGVRTWIRFGARQALPAIFVKSADGTESLVNFSVSHGDVVVQRVVRRLVLRRGRLAGCIVNKDFHGGGTRLKSGTVSPEVKRLTVRPESQGAP